MDSCVQLLIRRQGSVERHSLQLPIDSNDTVGDISDKVAKKLEILHPSTMKIIFCGRRLTNEMAVKDLRLGPQTCLTVTIIDELPGLSDTIPPIEDYEIVNRPNEPDFQPKTNSFYVYCKQCEKLNVAKLRAHCVECKSSAIEFIDEPSKWDDVIGSGKIAVNCQQCAKDTTARFIFKCIDCNNEGAILTNIQSNRADHECLICGEVEPILFVLNCSHTACVPCISAYLEQINNQWLFVYKNDVGFTMRCIMVDCESYVEDPHHFYLMGIEGYKAFQKMATEKYLHIQEGYQYCPYTECGASFMVDRLEDDEEERVICPECQRLFCLKCKSRGDCTCNEADKSTECIQKISKACPRCKAPTERDGGCSHLRCPNCTYEWCYVCEKEWSSECQWDHWFD